MVDFSKLRSMSAEETRARRNAAAEQMYAEDEAQRDQASKKALTITLDHEPEMRSSLSGEEFVLFRGREDGRQSSLVASYQLPLRAEQDDVRASFDSRLRDLGGGDRLSIAGSWSKRRWKSRDGAQHEAWEFKAQHFAKGDVPLDRMLSRNNVQERSSPGVHAARDAARGTGIQ